MEKIKSFFEKINCYLEKADIYINEHRWCSFLVNIVYLLCYITVLIVLIFYSMALLVEDINAQNIVTVVLAFSVFNNIFFKFYYK